MLRVKKDLKDLNPTDLEFLEETPCVPITEYYGRNEKWTKKKKDVRIEHMGKEALHDYFSKIYAQCYSLTITNFFVISLETFGLALQFSIQRQ